MGLGARIRAGLHYAVFRLATRRAKPADPAEALRADFSTHPGRQGLRFTDRLRRHFRHRWLRVR